MINAVNIVLVVKCLVGNASLPVLLVAVITSDQKKKKKKEMADLFLRSHVHLF